MPTTKHSSIQVGPLRANELQEADRIFRLAFGTFLGLPGPAAFMGDRDLVGSRFRSPHVKAIAARHKGCVIGSNILTRWGSFGFFGPLTVLPEYWNQGVAQRLLESTIKIFDQWGVRDSALFTFAQSTKHVGLYQKFGYWPGHLTAIATRSAGAEPARNGPKVEPKQVKPKLLSGLPAAEREQAIVKCAELTNKIEKGLDLTGEIRALLKQHTGEVVLVNTSRALDGFAICLTGPASEGGEKICYVKFGAARGGKGAADRFDRLLAACAAFADSRGIAIEAGVNLARVGAYERMRANGYRPTMQGVAMRRPHSAGFNRADAWVIDDWR